MINIQNILKTNQYLSMIFIHLGFFMFFFSYVKGRK